MNNLSRARSNALFIANQGIQSPNLSQIKRTDGENQRDFRTTATGVNQFAHEKMPSLQSPQSQSAQTFGHSNVFQLLDEFSQKDSDRLQFANPLHTSHLENFNNEESLQLEAHQFGSNPPSSVQIEADSKELDELPQEIGTSTPSSFSPQFTISAEDELEATEEDAKMVKLRDIQEAEQKLEKLVNTFVNNPPTSEGNKAIVDAGNKIFDSIKNIFDSNNKEHLAQLDKFKASLNKMLKRFEGMARQSSQQPSAKRLLDKFIALNKNLALPENIVNEKQLKTWEKLVNSEDFHIDITDQKQANDEMSATSENEGTVILLRRTEQTDCTFVISYQHENDKKAKKVTIDENGNFKEPGSRHNYPSIDELLKKVFSQDMHPMHVIQKEGSIKTLSDTIKPPITSFKKPPTSMTALKNKKARVDDAVERYFKIENLNKLKEELKTLISNNPNHNFTPANNNFPYEPEDLNLQYKYEKLNSEISKLEKELTP